LSAGGISAPTNGQVYQAVPCCKFTKISNRRLLKKADGFGRARRIYFTRTVLSAYFNFRVDRLSAQLKEQQTERAKTIQKLKDATKYDSTLELLQKYGGTETKAGKKESHVDGGGRHEPTLVLKEQASPGADRRAPGRTNMLPPATANIPRPEQMPLPVRTTDGSQPFPVLPSLELTEEFAPNAFNQKPHFKQYETQGGTSHWYDRILDLILGEDETAPKNRIILLCSKCRLVNGQAPPGTETLAQVGTWKCMACGTLNGEVNEGRKLVQEVLDEQATKIAHRREDAGSTMDSSRLVALKGTAEDEPTGLVEADKEGDETNRRDSS
jgi:endoplasmic reticulum junction formation protein lunapark